LLLCAGRTLTTDGTVPAALLLEELDFGMRRSGPAEAEREDVLFTGWKIEPNSKDIIIKLYDCIWCVLYFILGYPSWGGQ